jgi:hypothetical protein
MTPRIRLKTDVPAPWGGRNEEAAVTDKILQGEERLTDTIGLSHLYCDTGNTYP